MGVHRLSIGLRATAAIFVVALLATGAWATATEELLYSFGDKATDGSTPYGALIFDPSGNLYGITFAGGVYNLGTVFELTPKAGGGWTEKVLHNFNGKDGSGPYSRLIFDASGNLYGTTFYGGSSAVCNAGCGTVFELSPEAGGGWKEKVLHNFTNGTDGSGSYASLILDASGNLYGTTFYGGNSTACNGGCGTVFELIPKAGGHWKEKILHNFGKSSMDGQSPVAGLIFDALGNLYGTTRDGGGVHSWGYSQGTVFELTPLSGGGWREKILHRFRPDVTDGNDPGSMLIFDASGNLYGTTFFGGKYSFGTAFKLTPQSGGGWAEKIVHAFGANNMESAPSSLIFDAAGNLYGTTQQDNNGGGGGTVFELSPKAAGGWTENVLHEFPFNPTQTDGFSPYDGVIFDPAGNLYGTTQGGGTFGVGTVFEVTP
ncbi:MAG: choice-of-anchor tandem repeat GloVer-containing protein [Terriglobales bacterium]